MQHRVARARGGIERPGTVIRLPLKRPVMINPHLQFVSKGIVKISDFFAACIVETDLGRKVQEIERDVRYPLVGVGNQVPVGIVGIIRSG